MSRAFFFFLNCALRQLNPLIAVIYEDYYLFFLVWHFSPHFKLRNARLSFSQLRWLNPFLLSWTRWWLFFLDISTPLRVNPSLSQRSLFLRYIYLCRREEEGSTVEKKRSPHQRPKSPLNIDAGGSTCRLLRGSSGSFKKDCCPSL